jgi:hypothetical protein
MNIYKMVFIKKSAVTYIDIYWLGETGKKKEGLYTRRDHAGEVLCLYFISTGQKC